MDSTAAALRHRRMDYDMRRSKDAPSNLGIPAKFASQQRRPSGPAFFFSRPPSAAASIPVTLLHPIFSHFIQDCMDHTPTEDDNRLTLDMSLAMSEVYDSEQDRLTKFRQIMNQHGLEMRASTINGSKFVTDGDMRIGSFAYCLVEGKNEIGASGAEPIFKAGAYYVECMSASSHTYPLGRFPSLLLYLVGPHLGFVGAAFTDRPNIQVLVRPLPLFWHHTDLELRKTASRHFGALRIATQSLREYYGNPASFEATGNPEFPCYHQYKSLQNDSTCHIVYQSQFCDNLVFFGKTTDGDQICIKFAQGYSKDAHMKCAEMGHAPLLRGFEKLPGGWLMIVMDDLRENYSPFVRESAALALQEEVQDLLDRLNASGFVHGDIRDANLLVHNDGDKFMLVDFDWAGRIGEAKYAMNLNRGPELWRPEGARDRQLITPQHDKDMLNHMFLPWIRGLHRP